MRHPVYAHTQSLKLLWFIVPATLVGGVASLIAERGAAGWVGAAALIGASVVAVLVFGSFTIEVGERQIEWRFGVLGRPRWQLALDDIARVEPATSTWLEGWGIRFTRTGMLYNAQGLKAVRIHLRNGRTLRLGSDEPERLIGFISARLQPPATARPTSR